MSHDEYAVEPIPGLPERPPAGEVIIWQGAPAWRKLALRAFHVRKVAIYFVIIWLWMVLRAVSESSLPSALVSASWVFVPAVAGIVLLGTLAWFYARTTIYTITNERVVIRSGLALPTTVNLPFNIVESAGQKRFADGSGDLSLQLDSEQRASYVVLWPNVRPFSFASPEPTLRSLADVEHVGNILGEALSARADPEVQMPRVRKDEADIVDNSLRVAHPSQG